MVLLSVFEDKNIRYNIRGLIEGLNAGGLIEGAYLTSMCWNMGAYARGAYWKEGGLIEDLRYIQGGV